MKTTFTLLLIIIASVVNAQIEQGTRMIGASIGSAQVTWRKNESALSFSLNPNVAWFFSDRFAFGGSVSPAISKTKGQPAVFSLGVSPFVRLYNKGNSSDRFYLQANAGINGFFYQDNDVATYFTYGGGAGYNRLFTQNVALEISLNYAATKAEQMSAINGIAFKAGFQIFLARKK